MTDKKIPFGADGFDPPTGPPISESVQGSLGQHAVRAADEPRVSAIGTSMRDLIDEVVDHVSGVTGALVSSADGLVMAARVPHDTGLDAAAIAAMSAAVLGLSNRLVQLMGPAPSSFSHQRSSDGQVFVFGISSRAVLTVLADLTADPARVEDVSREVGLGLERLFRNTTNP